MSFRFHVAALSGLVLAATFASGIALADDPAPTPAPTGTLTRPPRLAQFVEASYPESERANGHPATVVLAVVIAADGHVEEVSVTASGGVAFDDAALAAVRRFTFEPAEIDGVPSRIRIAYRYEFAAYVPPPPPTPVSETAVFTGVIRNGDDGTPVAGATVSLEDGSASTTDATGRFRFEAVAPGPHSVTVAGPRIPTVQTEEVLYAGEILDTAYEVALVATGPDGTSDADIEILVFAPRLTRQAVVTEVSAEQARDVPGTSGEVVTVVNNLPGVGRAAAGSGAFVVWGASPDDTGVYVDGVRVPRLYHDGGMRAVMGSETVSSVQLVPGGYSADYGRGLGGLVMVSTFRADADDDVHATVSADIYDASASFRSRLGDRFSLSLAGRGSYVAPLLRQVASSDIEDFFPLPHYYDAQARVGVALRANEWMDVTALVSGDRTSRAVVNADPSRSTREDRDLSFQRVYLRYGRDLEDGSSISATVFAGADQRGLTSVFGELRTNVGVDSRMFGVRANYHTEVTSYLEVDFGFDSEVTLASVSRSGSLGAPPREGDIRVFGQPPPDQLGSDDYRATYVNAAPYVQAHVAAAEDTFHLTLGLRVDPYLRIVDRVNPDDGVSPPVGTYQENFRAEPRITARWAPSDRGYLQAAFGLYGQSPQASDLSSVFGNPTLSAAAAQHFVFGGSFAIVPELTAEVTTFYTRSSELAMRNQANSPAVATALVAEGSGRSYGAQVLVRLAPTHGLFGWVSYTLMKAERRDAPALAFRPFDFDQRHVLTALAGYELGAGFEIGFRLRTATGMPRTRVVASYFDSRRDLYQPTFGEHNGIRVPTFFQIDLRLAKHFDIHGTDLDISLEVQNVTNRANVEELIYNSDYTQRGSIRGLPILPVLGIRWSL